MATELTWLGHGCWLIDIDHVQVILDPFLNDSPTAPLTADAVEAAFILVSHGHYDHVADVVSIAQRTGAQVIANFEITQWLASKHGIENTIGMNLGGQIKLPFGNVKMTVAWHSSQLPDGADGGNPGGFLLRLADGSVYFPCDTALFSDMRLIAEGVDLAVLPIGDLFTMGPDDALEAVKLIRPQRVVPDHYNTWPPIEQDAVAWAARVADETTTKPVVLQPGAKLTL